MASHDAALRRPHEIARLYILALRRFVLAIRNRTTALEPITARIWAIDANAVNRRFETVVWNAKQIASEKEENAKGRDQEPKSVNFGDPAFYSTERDSITDQTIKLQGSGRSSTARYRRRAHNANSNTFTAASV